MADILWTASHFFVSRLACTSCRSEWVDVGRLLALYRIIPLDVWKNSCASFYLLLVIPELFLCYVRWFSCRSVFVDF